MTPTAAHLLDDLRAAGVIIAPAIDLDGPDDVLTDDVLVRVRKHKPALLRLLVEGDDSPPIVRTALAAFPDAVVEPDPPTDRYSASNIPPFAPSYVQIGVDTPADRYTATNPARQPVIDLLHPVEQADPDRARDLADAWMERIAICEIDGGLSPEEAEAIALAEISDQVCS